MTDRFRLVATTPTGTKAFEDGTVRVLLMPVAGMTAGEVEIVITSLDPPAGIKWRATPYKGDWSRIGIMVELDGAHAAMSPPETEKISDRLAKAAQEARDIEDLLIREIDGCARRDWAAEAAEKAAEGYREFKI